MKLLRNLLALVGLCTVIVSLVKNPEYLEKLKTLVQVARAEIHQDRSTTSLPPEAKTRPNLPNASSPKNTLAEPVGLLDEVSAVALGYFGDLQKGRYPEAVERLSPEFRQEKNLTKSSLAEYWRRFTIIRVLSIDKVFKRKDEVHVQMMLYFQKGSTNDELSGKADIRLVQIKGNWKIDEVSFNQ